MVVLFAEHSKEVKCGGSSGKLQVMNIHKTKLCRNSLGEVDDLIMSSPRNSCHKLIEGTVQGLEGRRGGANISESQTRQEYSKNKC